jgi:nucleoporin POM152
MWICGSVNPSWRLHVLTDFLYQGTGPWNLEMQVVGPKSSENMHIQGIETPRKTLQIPVPKAVDMNGGTFEINIG